MWSEKDDSNNEKSGTKIPMLIIAIRDATLLFAKVCKGSASIRVS